VPYCLRARASCLRWHISWIALILSPALYPPSPPIILLWSLLQQASQSTAVTDECLHQRGDMPLVIGYLTLAKLGRLIQQRLT
jgi:hypothetical protein